jgi:MFS family permease
MGDSANGQATTFAALRIRAFRRLWTGGFLYFLSVFAQMIARGSLAWDLTGDNTGLGLVTLTFGVTGMITTPLGGVIADRFPKRRVLLAATILLLVSSLWIAIAVQFDVIEFWMLLVASVIQAAGFSGLAPARMAFTAELVGRELLTNGVVLSQISMNINRVVGPVAAGALLAVPTLGISGVYWFCAGLTLVSFVLFAGLPAGEPDEDAGRRRPMQDLRDGIDYAARRPALRLLLITSTLVIMLAFPYAAFLPAIADEVFGGGDFEFAVLATAGAVGGLIASLYIAGKSNQDVAWLIQAISGLALGVSVVVFAATSNLILGVLISLPLGAASAAFQSMNGSLLLQLADPRYHGRMQSLLQLGFSAFGIFAFPLGAMADRFGLQATLFWMGIATTIVVAIAAMRAPAARAADARLVASE